MRELPILFTADMVKASDEGWKTHTRRIMKPQPHKKIIAIYESNTPGEFWHRGYCGVDWVDPVIKSPYKPGDHLWIKQNFQITGALNSNDHYICGDREDGSEFVNIRLTDKEYYKFSKWKKPYQKKSKLFMFKSLAYKWLEVISVRAERIQDITYIDAIKEGIPHTFPEVDRQNFEKLWDSINKDRGFPWESNCWVFDYEFKRIEK